MAQKNIRMKKSGIIALFIVLSVKLQAYDGSALWLRQEACTDSPHKIEFQHLDQENSATSKIVIHELRHHWQGKDIMLKKINRAHFHPEAFRIRNKRNKIIISAKDDIGWLYGCYYLLRQQSQGKAIPRCHQEKPLFERRLLNHWDNPDGSIERGYAGASIWQWSELPDSISPRYQAYARANASIGINGSVLNNVNASPRMLSEEYIEKVKIIADILRPYGIRVYLSVNFASPKVLSNLPTADPCDKAVQAWWQAKVREIYRQIPDFGGFLVKANSEGQPGPCDYGRSHAEGANMLADALSPYGGIVMWRAFVYAANDADRAKQAYQEFQPLDGRFRDNVIIQIKNGPVDFQPREPYSPLFTALKKTSAMPEFQITQEYLGQSNHLAYLAPMWKEFFSFVKPGSMTAIAGVSNIGDAENWCGHPFAQANWYAYGRLAWNPALKAEDIALEWIKQTICIKDKNKEDVVAKRIQSIMMQSREAVVDYMMPMGLHHLFAWGHHYGPEPWCQRAHARADWLPSYYHRADSLGIGFDRSESGSNAVAQYPKHLARQYNHPQRCPHEYLLWFHHLPWDYRLKNGKNLWENLCLHYQQGVNRVKHFQTEWQSLKPYLDEDLHREVSEKMQTQVKDAIWWKDACLLYFQTFSQQGFPEQIDKAQYRLEELMQIHLGISNEECPDEALLSKHR